MERWKEGMMEGERTLAKNTKQRKGGKRRPNRASQRYAGQEATAGQVRLCRNRIASREGELRIASSQTVQVPATAETSTMSEVAWGFGIDSPSWRMPSM